MAGLRTRSGGQCASPGLKQKSSCWEIFPCGEVKMRIFFRSEAYQSPSVGNPQHSLFPVLGLKKCPKCQQSWNQSSHFLGDSRVNKRGYLVENHTRTTKLLPRASKITLAYMGLNIEWLMILTPSQNARSEGLIVGHDPTGMGSCPRHSTSKHP